MAVKLTSLSTSAGCGCKLGPTVLDKILASNSPAFTTDKLLVGNDTRDDAAVYDLGDGTATISTTDFFSPVVDDPFDFGRIASANALSDVYAMGGSPLMAIAILGWPVDSQPVEPIQAIMDGARSVCAEAQIPLAGGHSIDNPQPIFGLAVTGRINLEHLKTNTGAKVGDLLYLLKPIGTGIISNAQKKGLADEEMVQAAVNSMVRLNKVGETLGRLPYVHALTDVTGFGLLGHLSELCQGARVGAEVVFDAVPLINKDRLVEYIDAGCVPGATMRNWQAVQQMVNKLDLYRKALLCDPQTSGGLLVSVAPDQEQAFNHVMGIVGYSGLQSIGRISEGTSITVS
ncbi:MAG: selenide, water dikinase SelD [Bradyrhizobiaceae bacterium]|nr:selenide, water dikinase SelD [Bradyrhizobiaceae bacterium]